MIQLSSRIIFFSIPANHFGHENVWHDGTWARKARKARGHARNVGTQGTRAHKARGHMGMWARKPRGHVGTQGTMARRARRARDLADSFLFYPKLRAIEIY